MIRRLRHHVRRTAMTDADATQDAAPRDAAVTSPGTGAPGASRPRARAAPEHPRSPVRPGARPAGHRPQDGAADREAARHARARGPGRGPAVPPAPGRRRAEAHGLGRRGARGRAGDPRRHRGGPPPGPDRLGQAPAPGGGGGCLRRHHAGVLRHAPRPGGEDAAARGAPLHHRPDRPLGRHPPDGPPVADRGRGGARRAARGRAGLRRHRGADLAGDQQARGGGPRPPAGPAGMAGSGLAGEEPPARLRGGPAPRAPPRGGAPEGRGSAPAAPRDAVPAALGLRRAPGLAAGAGPPARPPAAQGRPGQCRRRRP